MDEVIYLELDEEITSVIDKLKEIDGRQIALVIPRGAAIIQSVINLKVLKNEAASLNKDIVLVTQDQIGRNLASQVGLAVYDTIRSSRPIINPMRPEPESSETIELDLSEQTNTKTPKGISVHNYTQMASDTPADIPAVKPIFQKQTIAPTSEPIIKSSESKSEQYKPISAPSLKPRKKIALKLVLIGIIMLTALAVIYYFLPHCKINLTLQGESFETSVEIVVDNNINKIDQTRNAIPGVLNEAESEDTKTVPATGTKDVGEKAGGAIKLTNGTGDIQTISAGTNFTASGLVFVSNEAVSVPKATASVDSNGNVVKQSGTATVDVTAKEAGDKYNIGACSFSVSANVSAESTAAMTGGVSKKIKIVIADDINNAKTALRQSLIEKNRQSLLEKADKNQLIDSTVSNEDVSFSSSKTVNSEADSVEARMKVKSKAITFNETEYRSMIASALNSAVPIDKEVILSSDDQISTVAGNADFAQGILKINQSIKTNIGPKVDDKTVINNVKSQSVGFAEKKISAIAGLKKSEIKITPSWWIKRLPMSAKNISIVKTVEKSQ